MKVYQYEPHVNKPLKKTRRDNPPTQVPLGTVTKRRQIKKLMFRQHKLW
jgi:hypothetical protein